MINLLVVSVVMKSLLSSNWLSGNIIYIKINFSKNSNSTCTEPSQYFQLVKTARSKLNVFHDIVGGNVFAKLQSVIFM